MATTGRALDAEDATGKDGEELAAEGPTRCTADENEDVVAAGPEVEGNGDECPGGVGNEEGIRVGAGLAVGE